MYHLISNGDKCKKLKHRLEKHFKLDYLSFYYNQKNNLSALPTTYEQIACVANDHK